MGEKLKNNLFSKHSNSMDMEASDTIRNIFSSQNNSKDKEKVGKEK